MFFQLADEQMFRDVFTRELAAAFAITRTTVASTTGGKPATVKELAAIAGPATLAAFALLLGKRVGATVEAALAAERANPRPFVGATGDYPRGKLNADDEGGLNMAVWCQDMTVRVDFGKPVEWLGLDRDTAIRLADSIRQAAGRLGG